jgi:hypothetical protein
LDATNEYIFFGRNAGTAATYVDIVDTKQMELWTRQWFIQKTGSIDARLTFDYDAAGLTHVPLAVEEYQLLYKPTLLDDWTFVTFSARSLDGNLVNFELPNTDMAQGYYTLGRTDPVTLPVVFGSFDAYRKGAQVQLRWTTLSEDNSDRFEVERSTNGRVYTKIATVFAAGFSQEKLAYAYIDEKAPAGRLYYRLRQVDRNTKHLYSAVRQVQTQTTGAGFTKVSLYPNPTTGVVHVTLPEGTLLGNATVMDARGITIAQPEVQPEGETALIDISSLKPGSYLLRLHLSTGEVLVRSLVKQ